ncbi:MAG: PIG-L family deacetylase [Verrucomicrobia bacterium]|nr:PIG-L family deacetylase [Verrucomicrobiota bacterium]
MKNSAIAIFAHPDDIEFVAAGTLRLLQQRGWEIHYLNVSTGNCGSLEFSPAKTRRVRLQEGRDAAKILGAHFHPPLCDDLEILYEVKTLRRISAIIRESRASIVLTHAPHDYMEDHMNTCRLAVTAAFTHGMPNFRSVPPRATYAHDVTVYHAMPHGLRDGLRRRVVPGLFVNTAAVHPTKLAALAAHRSQQGWLDASQGMNSYLRSMEEMSRAVAKLAKNRGFQLAEGWRRHLHLGFSANDMDPLRDALGKDALVNRAYEKSLDRV